MHDARRRMTATVVGPRKSAPDAVVAGAPAIAVRDLCSKLSEPPRRICKTLPALRLARPSVTYA